MNLNLALETTADFAPGGMLAPDARAELAAQFIPAGSRVRDLSPGMALQALLPPGCSYQGGDRARCDGDAVCNIAAGDFPTQSDIIVMFGVLEQIADLETLFTHLRFCKQDMILSYYATDLSASGDRAARGFANALSFYDLALLFDRYGFRIECTAPDRLQPLGRGEPHQHPSIISATGLATI